MRKLSLILPDRIVIWSKKIKASCVSGGRDEIDEPDDDGNMW